MWRNLKLLHTWRNFRLIHICRAQKFEISPHDNYFSPRIYPWDPWQISGMIWSSNIRKSDHQTKEFWSLHKRKSDHLTKEIWFSNKRKSDFQTKGNLIFKQKEMWSSKKGKSDHQTKEIWSSNKGKSSPNIWYLSVIRS